MSVFYFANVGNRDIRHANVKQTIPRLSGKEWLNNYDTVKDQLDFPILRNGIEHVLQILDSKSIDRLVLFYTDQPKSVGEKYHQSDTLHYAELAKRLITERMTEQILTVELRKITGTPNDYDDMYRFYEDQLEQINENENLECAFFAPAGGTPACNMTMVMHGSRIFQQKSQVILISESPDSVPRSMDISSEIIRNHNRKAIEMMADHYDFGSIAKIMKQDERQIAKTLWELAEYMQYRLYFDFEKAYGCLKSVNKAIIPSELKDVIDNLSVSLGPFLEEREPFSGGVPEGERIDWVRFQKNILMEVSVNARVKWNSGQYVDFLGRMFRLQEGILRIFFEEQTGYSTDKDRYPEDFQNWCTSRGDEFIGYFESNPHNGKFKSIPTRKVLLEFLRFRAKTTSDYSEILKYCNKIDHLASLRNQSILAHGNKPINVDTVERIYGKKICQDVAKIARIWGLTDNYQQFVSVLNIIKQNY